jgi:hypothetical protein
MFPEYDKEKVYVSDMKKMIKWFAILNKLELLEEEPKEEEVIEAAPVAELAVVEEKALKPKAKKAAKPKAPKE